MTREEAIRRIEFCRNFLANNYPDMGEPNITAFNMAIEALEQAPMTGHWINDEFGSKCSCCGIYTHLDKFDRPMKFICCSMCGAKMDNNS